MISSWKAAAALLLLVDVLSIAWTINHHRNNAITFKDQRDKATHNPKLANATIGDMKVCQRDVATGKRRLQLNARCPARDATRAGGMGDASSPRLTDSAQRDYFTLRQRIATVTKQAGYLQDFIKQQCLK